MKDLSLDMFGSGIDYFVTDAPDRLSDLDGRVLGRPFKKARLVRLEPLSPAPAAA